MSWRDAPVVDGSDRKAPAKSSGGSGRGAPVVDRKAPGKKNTATDMAKGLGSGLLRGAAGVISLPDLPFAALSNMALKASGSEARVPTMNALAGVIGGDYKPETRAGRYSQAVGENALGAFLPGGPVRKTAQVLLPAVFGEGARETAESAGLGALGQTVAKLGGGVLGGVGAGAPALGSVQRASPLTTLNRVAPQNALAMYDRTNELRAAGIQPALVDVLDDGGRSVVGAAAMRPQSREAVRTFADQRRLNLPDRISTQARRTMSADPRTPRVIAEDLGQARRTSADQAFTAVRNEPVTMAPQTVQAMRTDVARSAIREAAKRERDPDTVAALNRLATDAIDAPATPITVGMADRVSRVLLGQAAAAARAGDNDLASTLGALGRDIRRPVADAVPGYQAALDGYAADSRLMAAAERGEDFLSGNTDEFVADLNALGPEGLPLARATARRAIERKAGENISAAPGVARKLALAPEQRARNQALLGADAPAMEQGMRLEERVVQNAADIAPRSGSPTAPRQAAEGALQQGAEVIGAGVSALRGNFIPAARAFLKTRGMSNAQAQALVEMAIDPAQADRAMSILEQQIGRNAALEFFASRPAIGAAAGAVPALSAGSAPQ